MILFKLQAEKSEMHMIHSAQIRQGLWIRDLGEDGVRLSGGQRKRNALLAPSWRRAILLLAEATSARLVLKVKAKVQGALEPWWKDEQLYAHVGDGLMQIRIMVLNKVRLLPREHSDCFESCALVKAWPIYSLVKWLTTL